ncbi:hypothetical protein MJO29_007878, partial [Puccinia striiformis f. sp. tritici]
SPPAAQSWEITIQEENRVLKVQKEAQPRVKRNNMITELSACRVIPDHNNVHHVIQKHHHKPGKSETPRYVFAHVVQGILNFMKPKIGLQTVESSNLTNKKQLPFIYEIAEMSLFHYLLTWSVMAILGLRRTSFDSLSNLHLGRLKLSIEVNHLPCCAGIDPKMVPLVDGMLSWDAWCPVSLSQDHRYRDNLAVVGKEYAAPLSAMFYKHLLDFK